MFDLYRKKEQRGKKDERNQQTAHMFDLYKNQKKDGTMCTCRESLKETGFGSVWPWVKGAGFFKDTLGAGGTGVLEWT